MNHIQVIRIRRSVVLVAVLSALLVALWIVALPSALAQGPTGGENISTEAPGGGTVQGQSVQPSYDDGGRWEVGVEHSADPLEAHARAEGVGLYNKLASCNWNRRFRWNNTWAWEEDFKRSALGGKESVWLDTVDLMFYVGHGGPGGFTFDNTHHDDSALVPNDCYRSWGDNDNEWVALTSCQVLADANLSNWARCFHGTHLILGFKTNAAAHIHSGDTQGYQFAKYLCQGYTVPQAWYKAADRSQPSGRVVRALINELAYLNDKPMCGHSGCGLAADSYDWDAWVQTHIAGSEPPRYVNAEALQGTMPIFRTTPLSLDAAKTQYKNLGAVFGVPVTPTLRIQQSNGDPIWTDVTGGHELEMDSNSGLYGYTDLNNLWTYTQTQMAIMSQQVAVTADDARATADQFLQNNGLMPGDARFYEVVSDTISGGDIVSGTHTAAEAGLLANEQNTVWQVIYSRILTYTPAVAMGMGVAATPVEFSVVGPGAKQKVYVSSTGVQSGALGISAQSDILGAIGGWRPIEQPQRGSSIEAIETVNILTADQILKLHEQLGDLVVLNSPPIDADGRTVLTYTLSYWEWGAGTSQAELIPTYALTVSYTKQSRLLSVDYAYIPANPTYMRPFARIESGPTGKVRVGETVAFTATEAATTLPDLGYDSSLNFVLGSGAPDDYIYDWYVNSTDDADNKIGSGRFITYTVNAAQTDRSGTPQQSIILKVTDITNPDQPSTTTSRTLDVFPRVFLPVIVKSNLP